MATRPKKYRKSGYWKQSDGSEVVGLKRRPDGRFYAADKPGKTFGKDPAEAVFRFKQWQSKQTRQSVALTHQVETAPDGSGPWEYELEIDADVFWANARRLYFLNPDDFKQRVGMLIGGPSMTLKAVGEYYFDHGGPTNKDDRQSCRAWWERFCELVGGEKRTVREVQPEHIRAYRDAIHAEQKKGKTDSEGRQQSWSRTWTKHRFDLVRGVFRFAKREHQDIEQTERVGKLCEILTPKKKREYRRPQRSQPISPEHLKKLLEVSNTKWRAVLLTAMNCLMHPLEAAQIRVDEVDLDKRTLIADRGKTAEGRVCPLWQRTIDAIRAYRKQFPHRSELLFVNARGAQYNRHHMGRNFRRRCKKARIPDTVTFDHIRDAGYTLAMHHEMPAQIQAKLMAGHAVDEIYDAYAARYPQAVAKASAAIESGMFPESCKDVEATKFVNSKKRP